MEAKPPTPVHRDWKPTAALLLLSLLWSIDSLRADLFPQPSNPAPAVDSTLATGAISFLLFAIVAGLFAAIRRVAWPRGKRLVTASVIGLGLFAAPAILVSLSAGWVAATTRVAIFSLAPVVAVVLEPYIAAESAQLGMAGLIGALAAVAGTLCIFPLQLPASFEAAAALAALLLAVVSIAVANCAAVHQARADATTSIAPLAATLSLTAAAGLAIASTFIERPSFQPSTLQPQLIHTVIALPALILLFWLMPRMSAARMTTRFVLAPLIAILIGIAIEQPAVAPRIWIGIVLVASGAARLLLAPPHQPDTGASLLNLKD